MLWQQGVNLILSTMKCNRLYDQACLLCNNELILIIYIKHLPISVLTHTTTTTINKILTFNNF